MIVKKMSGFVGLSLLCRAALAPVRLSARAVVSASAVWLVLLVVGAGVASGQTRGAGFSDLDVPAVPLRVEEKVEPEGEKKEGEVRRPRRVGVAKLQGGARSSPSLVLTAKVSGAGAALRMSESGGSLGGLTTGSVEVDSLIVDSGVRNGVDPLLIYSVMHQESSFKRRATSNKGASGLMQLMPGTAARFGVRNIYDARENIEGGAKYLRWLLDYFRGDLVLALAAYNSGEGAVVKYGWRVPPYAETQDYVRRIGSRYAVLRGTPAVASSRPGI